MSNLKLVGMSKEVADSYTETLAELTFNNKIMINHLTEIAKEYKFIFKVNFGFYKRANLNRYHYNYMFISFLKRSMIL